MLKIYTHRNNPIFPYDLDMTRFSQLTVYKVTEGYWEGYWEVTYILNGNVKIDHFPVMTKGLWKLIWGHFRGSL